VIEFGHKTTRRYLPILLHLLNNQCGSDPAQTNLRNPQIGSNVFQRNPLQNIRRLGQQGHVPLFRRMKLDAFDPVNGFYVTIFEYFPEQAFYFGKDIVQRKQTGGINGHDFRIFHDLNGLAGRLMGKKAFYPDDEVVFKSKIFRDVHPIFVIMNACRPFADEINGPAGMPDRL